MEQYRNLERSLTDLRRENERLLSQLGYLDGIPGSAPSRRAIIAKDPGNLYSTFVIDKGLKDGLRKNLPVVAYQDGSEGLVGKVLEDRQIFQHHFPHLRFIRPYLGQTG